MIIVALQGRSNSGKTTTLKELIKTIIDQGIMEYENVVPKSKVIAACSSNQGDVQCWFTYRGVKIGITTRGDDARVLEDDFFGKKRNFRDRDIVVCAIRSKGETVSFVEKHSCGRLIVHGRWFVSGTAVSKSHITESNRLQVEAILKDIKHFAEHMEEIL